MQRKKEKKEKKRINDEADWKSRFLGVFFATVEDKVLKRLDLAEKYNTCCWPKSNQTLKHHFKK